MARTLLTGHRIQDVGTGFGGGGAGCPHLSSVAKPLYNCASVSETPAVSIIFKATPCCPPCQGPSTVAGSS